MVTGGSPATMSRGGARASYIDSENQSGRREEGVSRGTSNSPSRRRWSRRRRRRSVATGIGRGRSRRAADGLRDEELD